MRFLRFAACAALSVLSTTACMADKGKDKDKDAADAKAASDSIPMISQNTPLDSMGRPIGRVNREPVSMGYLRVEGDSQIVTMELYRSPASYPPSFSTYKSADMQVASAVVGGTFSVTLSPVFGAAPNPLAFVQIQSDTIALPEKDPAGAAVSAFTSPMKVSRLTVTPNDRYPFATAAKSFRFTTEGTPVTGTMIVGRRGNHTYRILVQYPPEFGDGMAPRVGLILRHFRWDDDFTYLVN